MKREPEMQAKGGRRGMQRVFAFVLPSPPFAASSRLRGPIHRARDLLYGKSFRYNSLRAGDWIGSMNSPQAAIDLVHQAIAAGIFGQIQWDDRGRRTGAKQSRLAGTDAGRHPPAVARFCLRRRSAGRRPEARPDWLEANADRPAYYRDCWYRALVPVPDLFPHGLFVEVRLFDDDPQDPWVEIVNAHPQV
jgi:hypothetical protein